MEILKCLKFLHLNLVLWTCTDEFLAMVTEGALQGVYKGELDNSALCQIGPRHIALAPPPPPKNLALGKSAPRLKIKCEIR